MIANKRPDVIIRKGKKLNAQQYKMINAYLMKKPVENIELEPYKGKIPKVHPESAA